MSTQTTCSACGAANTVDARFCAKCGAPLAQSSDTDGASSEKLGYTDAVAFVVRKFGVDVVRNPSRFYGSVLDVCEEKTPELALLERNCDGEFLRPFVNVLDKEDLSGLSAARETAAGILVARGCDRTVSMRTANGIGQALSHSFAGAQRTEGFGGTASSGYAAATTHSTSTASNGYTTVPVHGSGTATRPVAPVAPAPVAPKPNRRGFFIGVAIVAIAVGIAVWFGRGYLFPQSTTLTFLGAGADAGSMEPLVVKDGSIVLPTCSFTRDGYKFVAWVDEEGNEYAPGDSITPDKNVSLSAKWEAVPSDTGGDSGGDAGTTETPKTSEVATQDNTPTIPTVAESTPVVQTTPAEPSHAESFPRMWSGTYTGTSSYVGGDHHISRAVAFYFTTVQESGYLEGICYVGTDDVGPGETYGTCYVSGNVDWNTGSISFSGTGWIDHGGLGDLREYSGSVDFASQTMGGTAWDVGTGLYETPWNVHSVSSISIMQNGSLTTVP